MFGLTTTRRLEAELQAARAETRRVRAERDAALDERDAFKEAARTAARIVQQGDVYAEGGRPGDPPTPLAVQLRRSRDQALALDHRLAELEAINQRCTCGGSITPHTPRMCACGHGARAHTVPAPHTCTAFGHTCPCRGFRQRPHDEAVAQLDANRKAAEERASKDGAP
jgi:hypothetical protein